MISAVIEVTKSSALKCPRCWHYHGIKENYDNLCDRCCKNIVENDSTSGIAQEINKSLNTQRKKYCVLHDKSKCKNLNCCMDE